MNTKMRQFCFEFFCACMIAIAMVYATSCCSISQSTVYQAIVQGR